MSAVFGMNQIEGIPPNYLFRAVSDQFAAGCRRIQYSASGTQKRDHVRAVFNQWCHSAHSMLLSIRKAVYSCASRFSSEGEKTSPETAGIFPQWTALRLAIELLWNPDFNSYERERLFKIALSMYLA